jgi:catechol 2,3-dioxygenase-like lactoylglutathione lyase family enzyme
MNWTLEVVPVPVSDVDRAKEFYAQQLGFNVDHDTTVSDELRIVQLTPPGSGCSVVIGTGLVDTSPGSIQGLQLVVPDIHAARAELVERGVKVSAVHALGRDGSRTVLEGDAPAGPDPTLDNAGFVFFSDPDGNGWAVQQISARRE